MNRHQFLGTDIALVIDRFAQHIHDATERLIANRNHDRLAGIGHGHAALQALTGPHCDGAHDAVTQLLLHFKRQINLVDDQRIVNMRDCVARECNIHHSANNLHGTSGAHNVSSFPEYGNSLAAN